MTAAPRRALSKLKYFEKTGYHPHPGQLELHTTPMRFKVVSNGRRWGKTLFGAKEAEPNAFVPSRITGLPQRGWIVGPQYDDGEKEFRIFYDSMRALGVDRDAIKFRNNPDSGAMHITTAWGFDLEVKSAAHPETLVGEGLDFVLMVEAGRHKRKTWGQYIRPTLSDRRGWAIFTGVPEGKSEHSLLYSLYQRGLDPQFPQWRSWKKPSWDNTIVFPLGRQDPEILEAYSDLTEDEFNRQYGAEFSEKTGVVMQEYDDDTHTGDFSYDPSWPLYMGVDYGFTNPFVVLWIQEGPQGQLRVIKEHRYTRLDTEEVAIDLLATVPGLIRQCEMIYPDPAEPDDTRTLMRKLRIPAAQNTGGELKTRLALIRRSLKMTNLHLPDGHRDKTPQLMIDRSCTQLRWEMREGYKWPERRSEVRSDAEQPMDKDNHGVEALGRFFRGKYKAPMADGGSFVTTARVGR
jgi:hypothetical protein